MPSRPKQRTAASADTGSIVAAPEDDSDVYADDGYGSEEEDDYLRLRPAATDIYVFVANPDRDTVTRIGVPSLQVLTAEVGEQPDAVLTTEDYSTAVTFNAGADSVSIIDAESLEVTDVEIRPNLNSMVMSPDGRWVVVYHDIDAEDEDDGEADGVQSFSEVSVVNLSTAAHTALVVGQNPRGVQFTEDAGLAVVVSDAYLAVIDLTAETLEAERIQLSEDTVDPPTAEEVLLALDGSYAFVRQYGVEALQVVDLRDQTVTAVAVGANPTDLDLTPDGERAVAVARGSNEVWVYQMADPFAEPTVLPLPADEVLGSVLMSPAGDLALLYSTRSGVSHLAAWELASDTFTVYGLEKPVSSVGITPGGSTALVFHDRDNGTDVDPDSRFYDHYGLTLIDLDDFFMNALLLSAEPTAYACADEEELGYFIMEGEPYLEALDYGTLLYEEIPLESDPVHLGVLPGSAVAYVNQDHELGRLSFYDPAEDALQTLTGFELNAAIEH